VLDEQWLTLGRVMELGVGDTLMLNATEDSAVTMRCGGVPMVSGRMGRLGQNIAVRVDSPFRRLENEK